MKLKKIKKQIICNNKFLLKNIPYYGFLADKSEECTMNINHAMYFSSFEEAEFFRKSLEHSERYKVITKREKHKKR